MKAVIALIPILFALVGCGSDERSSDDRDRWESYLERKDEEFNRRFEMLLERQTDLDARHRAMGQDESNERLLKTQVDGIAQERVERAYKPNQSMMTDADIVRHATVLQRDRMSAVRTATILKEQHEEFDDLKDVLLSPRHRVDSEALHEDIVKKVAGDLTHTMRNRIAVYGLDDRTFSKVDGSKVIADKDGKFPEGYIPTGAEKLGAANLAMK